MRKRQIATVDAETDPFKRDRIPEPFIWGFYDGYNYEEFYKIIDLIRFLIDKPMIIYAHNGGKFDWHFLLDFIEPFTNVKIINGRISKFKIGECEFRDSYNILPTPLSAFSKDEIDYNIFEKEERIKPHNWKKIQRYLYKDCLYLYEYVTGFIDRYGLCLTLAGAALKQWEKISELEVPDDRNGDIYEKFKKYYYGGRCEANYGGIYKGHFKMADINSAYPRAMLEKHPYSLQPIKSKGSPREQLEKWLALSDEEKGPSFITLKAVSKGALPYRDEDNSLIFPNDNQERLYNVTGWELMAALDTNSLRWFEFVEYYCFTKLVSFEEYIVNFYEQRKEAKANGDKAGDIFCKLLMNSLYGKFGANPDDYRNFKVGEMEWLNEQGQVDIEGRLWDHSGEFGPWALLKRELEDFEQQYYNVATAASITGYVRAFMWRAIKQCKGFLYCDTDSIAALDLGELPNGYGKELGQWELEGEFSEGAFCGKKLYAMAYQNSTEGYKVFSQGLKFDKKELDKIDGDKGQLKIRDKVIYKCAHKGVCLSVDQLYKIAEGEEIKYKPESPVFSVHKAPHFLERTVRMKKGLVKGFNTDYS